MRTGFPDPAAKMPRPETAEEHGEPLNSTWCHRQFPFISSKHRKHGLAEPVFHRGVPDNVSELETEKKFSGM